jgi:hypothetical protein
MERQENDMRPVSDASSTAGSREFPKGGQQSTSDDQKPNDLINEQGEVTDQFEEKANVDIKKGKEDYGGGSGFYATGGSKKNNEDKK